MAGGAMCSRCGRWRAIPIGGRVGGECHDVILIGSGHSGLVCVSCRARVGLTACVLERRGVLGGAAVTEEFHPGFRNSVASYTVSLLQQG